MDLNLSNNERFDFVNEDLSIIQNNSGLVFTTDSYVISAFAKKNTKGTMVDLGAGNGVITLLNMAKKKYSYAYSIEIQNDYTEIIKKNLILNNLNDNVLVINEDIRNIKKTDFQKSIDTVICNPPYYKIEHGKENKNQNDSIARRELNGDINDFCKCASKILKFGGMAYFVYPSNRLADIIYALKNAKLEPKRMITMYPDISSNASLVFIEAKKGAASNLIQSAPLIVYKTCEKTQKREFSNNMQKIYDTFSVDFIFQ